MNEKKQKQRHQKILKKLFQLIYKFKIKKVCMHVQQQRSLNALNNSMLTCK